MAAISTWREKRNTPDGDSCACRAYCPTPRGAHSPVAIIRQFPGSVKDYLDQFADWAIVQPDEPCPTCGACGCFIKHGTYRRWACAVGTDIRIRIQRLLCRACQHTHAILPSFIHPYRHYILPLIQAIIQYYLLEGASYRQRLSRCGAT